MLEGLRALAIHLRRQLGLGERPATLADVWRLAEPEIATGRLVVHVRSGCVPLIFYTGQRHHISLPADQPEPEIALAFAHELGHYFQDLQDPEAAERYSQWFRNPDFWRDPRFWAAEQEEETMADAFAEAFLGYTPI